MMDANPNALGARQELLLIGLVPTVAWSRHPKS